MYIHTVLMPNSFFEQNTTVNDKSTAGRFDPKVFVNCVQYVCTNPFVRSIYVQYILLTSELPTVNAKCF